MAYILSNIIRFIAQALEILIIVRIILSWVGQNRFNPLVIQIYRLTDPLLKPFQGILPPHKMGGIDISPIFTLMAIRLIERFLLIYFAPIFY